MSEPVITVDNLGKTYWLYPNVWSRLLGCFIEPRRVGARAFPALSGLCFELHPGEAIALIGKNGAGKSTALQVLAGITPPSEGSFHIHGRVCALLELGSGFNPEFTGRQNIALAGMLLGLTREQIREEEQNIIDFADIGEFIDQPVKFYSSGMFVRLAFAVAVAGQPDLLIVDEALAVGDIFFRQKCYARLREMREKGMAVILVTHSQGDVTEFCDRAILLEHGRQTYMGDPQEVMLRYYISMQPAAEKVETRDICGVEAPNDTDMIESPFPQSLRNCFTEVEPGVHVIADRGRLLRFCLTDERDIPRRNFTQGSRLRLYAQCAVDRTVETPFSTIAIWAANGTVVYNKGTHHHIELEPSIVEETSSVFVCHEVKLNLAAGEYTLGFGFSEAIKSVYRNRYIVSHEEWVDACTRRINIAQLAIFSVSVPAVRRPPLYFGAGLVDLPGGAWMKIQPLHSGNMHGRNT